MTLFARVTAEPFLRGGWIVLATAGMLTTLAVGTVSVSSETAGTRQTAARSVQTAVALQSTHVGLSTQIGVYRTATSDFSLRGVNGIIAVHYGVPGDRPILGDWDGDSFDTLGVKRGNTYYLRNVNRAGSADITFSYGRATDTPVMGDWNGDGRDTIAVRRDNIFYVRNSLSTGPADYRFSFGTSTDTALAGDWDADMFATGGAFRTGTNKWYVMTGPGLVASFSYGRPGDVALTGDWNGDTHATVGVRRGSTFYLTNSLSGGAANITANFGAPEDLPVAGHWDPPIATPD